MADDLVFPRLVYRGLQDVLGLGKHVNAAGELVGETLRVNSPDEWDAAQTDGWRLTSAMPAPEAPKPTAKDKAAKDKS